MKHPWHRIRLHALLRRLHGEIPRPAWAWGEVKPENQNALLAHSHTGRIFQVSLGGGCRIRRWHQPKHRARPAAADTIS